MSRAPAPPKQEVPKFTTVQIDPRFPNTNVTGHCWRMFYDYHRCIGLFSADYEPCEYFKKVYSVLCPNAWVQKWEEQIRDHTFPRDLPGDFKE